MTSPPSVWRPTLADPYDFFTADEVDRARAYQRPLRWMRLVRVVLSLVAVVVFLLVGAGQSIVESAASTPWPVQLGLVFVALEALLLVIDVPIDVWVDFGHDRRWELSTQTPSTFVADQVKSFALSTVLGLALLVPLYALIRNTSWWWLVGWLLVTTLGILLGFLYPVVIAPVFNRFEPLRDEALARRLAAVAAAARVPIAGVLVADESRRSRRDNAYVSGLGATRRVVLFDTILEHPPELIEQVVAHEFGHWRRHHLRQQIPVLAVTTLIAFAVLRLLAGWQGLFAGLDLDGLGDPASLPLLLLGVQLGSLLTGVVTAWFSRAHEREADLDALELLSRPDDMVEMLRRLHVKNLSDLDPGKLQRLRASHPTAAERMAFARAWQASVDPSPFTSM